MKIFGLNISRAIRSKGPHAVVKNSSSLQTYCKKGLLKIGNNTVYQNSKIEIRTDISKEFVSIGNDSIVNGNYVIENEYGRITIGDRTFMGGGLFISVRGISIGNDVMFSWGCTVMDNDAHSLNWHDRISDVVDWKKGLVENLVGKYKNWENVESAPVKIGDKCWIGFNVIILKGVTIGEGAVVAAGSVVTKDVAPYTLVGGNPARHIRDLIK